MDRVELATAGLVVLLLGVIAVLVVLWLTGRATKRATGAESTRQFQEQLAGATRLLADMGTQLASARAEAREEAERSRARQAQAQVDHMVLLQKGVRDMAGLTHQQLEGVQRSMHERMQHLTGTVGEQLGSHAKVIMEVKGQLGGLAETAKHIQSLGKDISSLQDILRAPKLRGNLGELFLEEILRQVLPAGSYEMQYRMPGAERGSYVLVDAIIRLGDRLVPIDSKFPLESFQRLLEEAPEDERIKRRKAFIDVVCKHIDAIAEKYIRPDAGTYDFALAYLPAETIYYEAIVRDDASDGYKSVVAYAAQRKVIPVSPNTLYAYLLTVAYGLKGLQIERQAEAMRGELAGFNKKFIAFYQVFEKVGRNLDLAQRGYDDAVKRASRLNDQVGKITGSIEALDGESDSQLALPSVHLVSAADS